MLVPRPETETVVEAALDFVVRGGLRLEKLRVLDIGTGSGALLLALLHELPNAIGIGTDVERGGAATSRAPMPSALQAWRRVAISSSATSRPASTGPFDLIVSNPPYIARGEIATLAPEVRDYDPRLALDGGAGWPRRLSRHRGRRADVFWRRAAG